MNLNISRIKIWTLAAVAAAGVFSSEAQPTNHGSAKDFSSFQIINDRNIFDPQRRPAVTQQVHTTPPPKKVVDSFSLVGTMSYSNLLLAFFDGTSADYRKSLAIGGKIASFDLTQITPNTVTLKSETNETILKVGMQMRRSDDGVLTATDEPANDYALGNSGRNSNSRRSDYGRSRSRSGSSSTQPQGNGGNAPAVADSAGADTPPPDVGNLDSSDPVARMIARRLQAEGGPPPESENPPGENGPNEDPVPDTNTNTNTEPRGNIPGGPPQR